MINKLSVEQYLEFFPGCIHKDNPPEGRPCYKKISDGTYFCRFGFTRTKDIPIGFKPNSLVVEIDNTNVLLTNAQKKELYIETLRKLKIPFPNLILDSGNKSLHFTWLIENMTLPQYRVLSYCVNDLLSGDEKVIRNLVQPTRIPDAIHDKTGIKATASLKSEKRYGLELLDAVIEISKGNNLYEYSFGKAIKALMSDFKSFPWLKQDESCLSSLKQLGISWNMLVYDKTTYTSNDKSLKKKEDEYDKETKHVDIDEEADFGFVSICRTKEKSKKVAEAILKSILPMWKNPGCGGYPLACFCCSSSCSWGLSIKDIARILKWAQYPNHRSLDIIRFSSKKPMGSEYLAGMKQKFNLPFFIVQRFTWEERQINLCDISEAMHPWILEQLSENNLELGVKKCFDYLESEHPELISKVAMGNRSRQSTIEKMIAQIFGEYGFTKKRRVGRKQHTHYFNPTTSDATEILNSLYNDL